MGGTNHQKDFEMRLTRALKRFATATITGALLIFAGCGGGDGPSNRDTGMMDAGDSGMDGGDTMDAGDTMDGGDGGDPNEEVCQQLEPPSSGDLCEVQMGNPDQVLLVGDVLTPDKRFENGGVLIDRSNNPATISCTGCNCAEQATNPTVIRCPEGVISPSLINPHDHLGWAKYGPISTGETRYDHRHEWRTGARGADEINTPSSDYSRPALLYGELRHIFGGATSIAASSSGNADNDFLRNLDNPNSTGGIEVGVDYSTFPLGDTGGQLLSDSCDYPRIDGYGTVSNDIYLPHIAEGIDPEAANEFSCLSTTGGGARDLTETNTSIIHGIGMTASDIRELAANGGHLVWSPRTNISLYGQTADIMTYRHFDVPISLGTDWPISGSPNMLRELACVDYLNSNHYNGALSDKEMWEMATYNGALALGVEDRLGALSSGYIADIAVFDGRDNADYRAVIDADESDVHLVMRGGEPLLGDASVVDGLVPSGETDQCESLDVCGQTRKVCVARDAGDSLTLQQLRDAADSEAYPLFSCDGAPAAEPTCVPSRPSEYTGMSSMDDPDGDGIETDSDICPNVFNPPRPLGGDVQPDSDGDGVGDACDPCPTSADDSCNPEDWDLDGEPNADDNCPWTANSGQADDDEDGVGDACDSSTTIYAIKDGTVATGERATLQDVVVTGVAPEGVYVQVPSESNRWNGAQNSGIFVYLGDRPKPDRGDHLYAEGRVVDFFGKIQLSAVHTVDVTATDQPLPDPVVFNDPCEVQTDGADAQSYVGALVRVEDVTVTDGNPDGPGSDFGEFSVADCGGPGLRVDDQMFAVMPDPEVGDDFSAIQGPLDYSFGNTKIQPRDTDDIVFGPAELAALEPSPVYLQEGTSGVPLPNFEAVLEGPSGMNATVDFTYPSPGIVDGPANVTIPAGQERLQIQLNGNQAASGPTDFATVEASIAGGPVQTADVLVYNDNTTRGIDDLSSASTNVSPDQMVTVTLRLNVPASSSGQMVNLSSGSDLGLPGSSVTVPAGTFETTFQVDSGSMTGQKTLTASIGGSSSDLMFTVQAGPTGDCFIISEYIEGSSNNKALEFYNCGTTTLTLADYGVCRFSNQNTTCGFADMFEPSGSPDLAPGQVYTYCNGDLDMSLTNNCDETSATTNVNGDDRVIIFEDTDGDDDYTDGTDPIIDAFGQPTVEPSGNPWSEVTYRRCNQTPYTAMSPFVVEDYYTSHGRDDFSDFGMAPTTTSCPTP